MVFLGEYVFKSVTDNLNYHPSVDFESMHLLKVDKHEHGNSIYFTRDNMVCFLKSGHILYRALYSDLILQTSFHFISILPGILCRRSSYRQKNGL